MANKGLFSSWRGVGKTDTVNASGAPAYQRTVEQALAQYALTGCFNQTFYAAAEHQVDELLRLAQAVDPVFLARTALYAREHGYMKDAPAFLLVVLSMRDKVLFEQIFPRVIDNGRMLRTFVQLMRSGLLGRRSLGTVPRRCVRSWLETSSDARILEASIGQSPSLADILKLVHPRPHSPEREAFYGYLLNRPHETGRLPEVVRQLEAVKAGDREQLSGLPFQLLLGLPLDPEGWKQVARQATWQQLRMNLNTFHRHGVFDDPGLVAQLAARLQDRETIRRSRVLPYQLLAAHASLVQEAPAALLKALELAMEVAIENVPRLEGPVYVCPDVSGSMQSPVTGVRRGATSVVRCVDVAALVAAAVLRRNPQAKVLPFETRVVPLELDARATVLENAQRLAAVGGGGTSCSAPLAELNRQKASGSAVIFVSDNESWADERRGRGTAMMVEWEHFKRRNPQAKLVCIDLQPGSHTQAQERPDTLNVGGFSDHVFSVVANFLSGMGGVDLLVQRIQSVLL